MDMKQIYTLVNDTTSEILGEQGIINEDLSNLVDVGNSIAGASSIDAYVRSLVNHIGKVIFVNRAYRGGAPSVMVDGWIYGSICEKIRCELPDARVNESWELQDGFSYDPNVFYKPVVSAKFFNKRVTFEIDMSFTEKQVLQSFSNGTQLNAFVSMLYNAVEKSLTVKIDSLIMRTINNMIAETVYAEMPSGTYTGTSIKAVNLLYEYNQSYGTSLTAAQAVKTPDFIRFASYKMGLVADRMKRISTLFNVGGTDKFTPSDMLHVVMLSDFAKAADAFLQSGTYHDEFTRLPDAETVPYWQGSGTGYAFTDVSKIEVTTASGHDIEFSGILGVMFDRDALGVTNVDRRVTTNYNAKGEFYNNFFKFDAGYFNDLDENFVVFYVA